MGRKERISRIWTKMMWIFGKQEQQKIYAWMQLSNMNELERNWKREFDGVIKRKKRDVYIEFFCTIKPYRFHIYNVLARSSIDHDPANPQKRQQNCVFVRISLEMSLFFDHFRQNTFVHFRQNSSKIPKIQSNS